jgi:hypothetical protein
MLPAVLAIGLSGSYEVALRAAPPDRAGESAAKSGISKDSRPAIPPAEGAADRAGEARIKPATRRDRLSAASDEAPQKTQWLTAEQVQQLGPVSFTSSNTSLRQALRKISAGVRLAIVLDRRVDPEQDVEFDVANTPLVEALAKVAAKAQAGAAVLGAVAYIGPPETARDLRTLAALASDAAGRQPARQKQAALASRPLRWAALATPAEVLQLLGDEAGVEIKGLDQIPHDLLAATDLPAMPWVDRLTLVAAQFGLTFRFDRGGRAVTLVPIRAPVRIERSYPSGRDARAQIERFRELAPDAEITASRGRIVVRGRLEDQERVAAPKAAAADSRPGEQVYTLTYEGATLDSFLKQAAEKLGLEFEVDWGALAAAGVKPASPVAIDVQNASLDELLRAAFDPLGLKFERRDKTVKVSAKPK